MTLRAFATACWRGVLVEGYNVLRLAAADTLPAPAMIPPDQFEELTCSNSLHKVGGSGRGVRRSQTARNVERETISVMRQSLPFFITSITGRPSDGSVYVNTFSSSCWNFANRLRTVD